MLLIFTKRRWGNYWQLLRRWFEHKIDELKAAVNSVAQSIDFTPVNNKLDTISDKIDNIDIDTTDLAKQGTNANATLTAVLEALTGGDDPSPDIPEGLGDRINLLLQFFGLPEALPEYEAMTETEVKAMSDEVFAALYGHLAVTATMHYSVGGNDITSHIYPKYKRMVSVDDGQGGTTSELQDVTYGQQGFTNLYKMDEDTESQTYGQYVSCLNDVPAEGDTVYYLPTNN